jgi:hypothetical protein
MDADERVKGMLSIRIYSNYDYERCNPAAISMTLCELRTAEFHSIPLECEVLLEEGASGGAPHGVCVE